MIFVYKWIGISGPKAIFIWDFENSPPPFFGQFYNHREFFFHNCKTKYEKEINRRLKMFSIALDEKKSLRKCLINYILLGWEKSWWYFIKKWKILIWHKTVESKWMGMCVEWSAGVGKSHFF